MNITALGELERRGDLIFTADGRLVVSGLALKIMRWLDQKISGLGDGLRELQFSSVIEGEILQKANYFESFPNGATRVESGGGAGFLAPAVCYHCFGMLGNTRLEAPLCVGCVGKCYRNENSTTNGVGRLWEFTMREFVFIATPDAVRQRRREFMDTAQHFAHSLGLEGRLQIATDPFFGNVARGRKLLQQLKELKYEFVIELPGSQDNTGLALASFNLHETFFTSRFAIELAGETEPHSGCVAFGLERWMLALLATRGVGECTRLVLG